MGTSGSVTTSFDARPSFADVEQHANPYHAALVELAKSQTTDASAFVSTVLETDAAMLGVERVSYWRCAEGNERLVCEDLFVFSRNRHERGAALNLAQFPHYTRAIGENRSIAVDDARSDPRTREFFETYLEPNGITSMLDAPIWRGGRVVGVVCHEHCGQKRHWTAEEEEFGAAIADILALGLETAERNRIAAALRQNEQRLRLITERLPGILWTTDHALRVTSCSPCSVCARTRSTARRSKRGSRGPSRKH
jgi:GAF domain-containing protein